MAITVSGTNVQVPNPSRTVSAVRASASGWAPAPSVSTGRNVDAGSLYPGLATYAIPGSGVVKYVAPGGSDAAGGTLGAPYQTIQHAINVTSTFATIILRAGVYHEGGAPGVSGNTDLGITISSGHENLTIQAYPGETVWLDGSSPMTGWVTDTTTVPGHTIYRVPYTQTMDRSVTFTRGSVDGTQPGYIWLNAADPTGKIANCYDQVILVAANGVETPLEAVSTVAEVVPGTFFVAGAFSGAGSPDNMVWNATLLYIGNNPASYAEVRVSDKTVALACVADNTTIKGFGVRRYAGGNADGGTIKFRRNNGYAENIYCQDSSSVGFDAYLNTRVGPTTLVHCTSIRHGLNGLHAQMADNLTLTSCSFQYANTHNWNMAPAAGGAKITACDNVTITGSTFNNNNADGVWFDVSCFNLWLGTVDAQNNGGHGFEVEVSAQYVLADFLSTGNGKTGSLIRCTDASRRWCGTVADNVATNIDCTQDARRTTTDPTLCDSRHPNPTDPAYGTVGMDWIIQAVDVFNCVSVNTTSSGALMLDQVRSQPGSPNMPAPLALSVMGPNIDGNLYGSPGAVTFGRTTTGSGSVSSSSLPNWQVATLADGAPCDANSVFVSHNPLNPDYSLTTADAAAAASGARELPADIAVFLGRTIGDTHVGAYMSTPGPVGVPVGDLPGWHQIAAQDFTTDVALGGFTPRLADGVLTTGPYAGLLTIYPDGWADTSGNALYYPSRTASVANSTFQIFCHYDAGLGKAIASTVKVEFDPGKTANTWAQIYGRYQFRMRATASAGIYGGCWQLTTSQALWPTGGESDIVEGDFTSPTGHGNWHPAQAVDSHTQYNLPAGVSWDKWHTYTVEWTPGQEIWWVDGVQYLNVATQVGTLRRFFMFQSGSNGAPPAQSTTVLIEIDWVAIWEAA